MLFRSSTKAAITGDTSSAVDVFLDWHGTGFTRGMYNIVGSNTYLPANLTRWNTLAAAHFDMTLADMQSAAPSGYMMDYAYTTLGAKFSCGVEHSQRGTNTKEYRETTGINWLKTLRSADADKMFYSAPEVVAPAGTVTIGTVTVTTTTASVPYSYSGADATGFEYRVNGGAVVSASSSPQSLSSLTPNTAYQIEIRAVNSAGSGAWSSPSAFETEALVVPAVVINVVGIPNGSYKTSLFNHATGELLTRSDMTYVNGRSVYETGLPLGVKISGYVIDNLDPATNGSVIYCEVTNAAE